METINPTIRLLPLYLIITAEQAMEAHCSKRQELTEASHKSSLNQAIKAH
jgi:hypothetical protein